MSPSPMSPSPHPAAEPARGQETPFAHTGEHRGLRTPASAGPGEGCQRDKGFLLGAGPRLKGSGFCPAFPVLPAQRLLNWDRDEPSGDGGGTAIGTGTRLGDTVRVVAGCGGDVGTGLRCFGGGSRGGTLHPSRCVGSLPGAEVKPRGREKPQQTFFSSRQRRSRGGGGMLTARGGVLGLSVATAASSPLRTRYLSASGRENSGKPAANILLRALQFPSAQKIPSRQKNTIEKRKLGVSGTSTPLPHAFGMRSPDRRCSSRQRLNPPTARRQRGCVPG
ncbi:uncharacterized protein LOC126042846 [Accipiter gentilis]|uniref:uncharacterized protein LOC126042846 n=1 Tax=Astur gentilis TaxID=8957 RepID=UPI00210F6D48|nr:uncharacterized protein LOC126042846 [Accipiter gentilis]